MSAVVGIVETRPETVADDYRRVLDLGGLGSLAGEPAPLLVSIAAGDPGFSSPAWQIRSVREALGLDSGEGVALPLYGPRPQTNVGWDESRPLVLLTVPVLESGWGVRNAVAAWAAVNGSRLGDSRQGAKDLAKTLGSKALGPKALQCSGVVCDGVLWGIGDGTFGKGYVQRNVLVAGTDPVAVDHVVMQLSGLDPVDFPWLKAFPDYSLESASQGKISLKGQVELLSDPFMGAPLAGQEGGRRTISAKFSGMLWRILRRRKLLHRYRESAWGQLATSLENH